MTHVLIAGGASGIGRALAASLLADGATVTIAGRDAGRLAAAAALGGAVRTAVADITAEADVEKLMDQAGPLDHVVSTAIDASTAYMPIAGLDPAAVAKVLATKVLGPLLLAKHAAPWLAEGGSLTFTSGFNAYRPAPGGAAVSAANGALESVARALAVELAPVRVNVVSPGWVDTDIWDVIAGGERRARLDAMAARLPVGRVAEAGDLAHAYRAVMANPHITGTVVHVDGGQRLV